MNAEADSIRPYKDKQFPTRLREYAKHVRANDNAWERAWTDRLAELFSEHGIIASRYSLYESGEIGDLHLNFGDGASLWIEIKRAWRYNLYPKICSNSAYLKHLKSITEGAARDLIKLQRARSTHVGMLIVGFDAPLQGLSINNADIHAMQLNGRFNEFSWHSAYDEWEDGVAQGTRSRIWYWQRPQVLGS